MSLPPCSLNAVRSVWSVLMTGPRRASILRVSDSMSKVLKVPIGIFECYYLKKSLLMKSGSGPAIMAFQSNSLPGSNPE